MLRPLRALMSVSERRAISCGSVYNRSTPRVSNESMFGHDPTQLPNARTTKLSIAVIGIKARSVLVFLFTVITRPFMNNHVLHIFIVGAGPWLGLAAAFLLGSCAGIGDEAYQVIYVPNGNGVQAQRVSVGPPEAAGRAISVSTGALTARIEGPQRDESPQGMYSMGEIRTQLLTSSSQFEYLGQISQPLFVTDLQLDGRVHKDDPTSFERPTAICSYWRQHVTHLLLNVGNLVHCTDYKISGVEIFRDGEWRVPDSDYHVFRYGFTGLDLDCREIGGVFLPCEVPPLWGGDGREIALPLCVIAVTHMFRTGNGKTIALIESVDPRVYGTQAPIDHLSSPEQSHRTFSRDFTINNTREHCTHLVMDNM